MKVLVLSIAVAVVVLSMVFEGDAICCYRQNHAFFEGGAVKNRKVCGDCSKGTPYCSYSGKCNVFGCNCDGGCRMGRCSPVKQHDQSGYDVIATHDRDGDGRLNMDEAAYVFNQQPGGGAGGYNRGKRSLWDLDLDQDSFLTAEEIDPDY